MDRPMSILVLGALLRLLVGTSAGPAEDGVTFRVKNAGIAVNGSFSELQTDIRFDPAHLRESTLTAVVDARSIQTGIRLRDRHLQKQGYFDTERYPQIRMTSKQLERKHGHHYLGRFELTIRDVTREVDVPFTYVVEAGRQRFVGQFTLNRQDYGVGGSSLTLADAVTVFLNVTTTAQVARDK